MGIRKHGTGKITEVEEQDVHGLSRHATRAPWRDGWDDRALERENDQADQGDRRPRC